ncbi:MAG: Galactoside O-acetyltransferase [Firmicutes bacterium ADurb.Bin456]|nr:MAG: Galactoside O-acetyltransferase [Firmicutes bacterium ADurb.Bin456]
MRKYESFPSPGEKNSMRYSFRLVSLPRVAFHFLIITLCRYIPFLELKNTLYRFFLGMQVGRNVSVGLMAMFDVFFPELIFIGDNTIIGYNVTVLTHEFLVREYRKGPVEIGAGVLIGSNATILPGVRIGDGAVVGAGSLVNRDIPPGALAAGVPARVRRRKTGAGGLGDGGDAGTGHPPGH